ncbi:hypothetical protein CBS101457_000922 [Exobasidium rhododendri]|nr:hypothetical protein CBS101457_000922 [Exobasidium rhododendri]
MLDDAGASCSIESDRKNILAAFPYEVFEAIFSHLSPLELSRLAQSSRSFYRISTTSPSWEQAYFSFWREGDERREAERGTRRRRENRRYKELKEAAGRAWSADVNASLASFHHSKRAKIDTLPPQTNETTPFPRCLSGGPMRSDDQEADTNRNPYFYQLFLERIRIDDQVLESVNTQIQLSTCWLERVKDIVDKYGNDAKDVLHALIASQSRKGDNDKESFDPSASIFPTALQVRLPRTRRSPSHHLSLLHYGKELLEHLQCREALSGLVSRREGCATEPSTQHWLNMRNQEFEDTYGKALRCASLSKEFENLFSWLSMFRGGEGQEISEELDTLAVSCSLYLASKDITLEKSHQRYALGIYSFMCSRSFKGALLEDFHNLDNNFLHFCLDESGRETLPMSLSILYCGIASRLGLSALPTNTPAKVLVVVDYDGVTSSLDGAVSPFPDNAGRFWIDVYGDGKILNREDIRATLAQMRMPLEETSVSQSTPVAACLRASMNIVRSVQEAQNVRRVNTSAAPTVDEEEEEEEEEKQSDLDIVEKSVRADRVFDRLVLTPNNVFHPRRTYLAPSGPQLVSPFCLEGAGSRRQTKGRYHRRVQWSDFDQQSAMHAASNALTRLGTELGVHGIDWCATLIQTYFPLDTLVVQGEMVDSDIQSPLYIANEAARRSTSTMFQNILDEDSQGPTPKRRLADEHAEMYKVGTVFVHRVYGYTAVILDWSEKCDATEEWMRNMGVDRLPNGGRIQHFYQSMVEDGSTRYVAHCNITPAALRSDTASRPGVSGSGNTLGLVTYREVDQLLEQRGIGKIFRCLSAQKGQLHLVMNGRGQRAFPDD